MLLAALLTDYELGVVRQIPMKMHLTMDAILGLLLAPWLFDFAGLVWIPHVVLGLGEFMGLMTKTQPSRRGAASSLGMR